MNSETRDSQLFLLRTRMAARRFYELNRDYRKHDSRTGGFVVFSVKRLIDNMHKYPVNDPMRFDAVY
jgi:hypothetical protein